MTTEELLRQLAPTHGGTSVYVPKGRASTDTAEVHRLRGQGMTVHAIALRLGVCARTVQKHLGRRDIE